MAGYSSTPLWKKLGYKPGMGALAVNEPESYRAALGLPAAVSVTWLAALKADAAFVHYFATRRSELKASLRVYRKKLAPDGVLWISWPKQSSGVATDITEDTIRAEALPLGFVDIKVCAVDEVWSGLKLVIRKELRQG